MVLTRSFTRRQRLRKCSYFYLPPEIRNRIMYFVLSPGDIYLKRDRYADNIPPGNQLLATCRQAYDEGHAIYYSTNIFHLPPGPIKRTQDILANVQQKHINLIKEVCITWTFADFTPEVFEDIEAYTSGEFSPTTARHGNYLIKIESVLTSIWKGKLDYVRDNFPGLEDIHLDNFFLGDPVDDGVTNRLSTKISTTANVRYTVMWSELFFQRYLFAVMTVIAIILLRSEWRGLKSWLKAGEWSNRADPTPLGF